MTSQFAADENFDNCIANLCSRAIHAQLLLKMDSSFPTPDRDRWSSFQMPVSVWLEQSWLTWEAGSEIEINVQEQLYKEYIWDQHLWKEIQEIKCD